MGRQSLPVSRGDCTMREFLMAVAISGFILGLALATG
jgi:hypothetical protein